MHTKEERDYFERLALQREIDWWQKHLEELVREQAERKAQIRSLERELEKRVVRVLEHVP